MGLILQEQDKLIALMPGVYHADIKEMYKPSILGLTEEALVIYNDHAPDGSLDGDLVYNIQRSIKLKDISHIYIEDVEDEAGKIDYCYRFNVIGSQDDADMLFYYKHDEKQRLKNFVAALKSLKIKVKKRLL